VGGPQRAKRGREHWWVLATALLVLGLAVAMIGAAAGRSNPVAGPATPASSTTITVPAMPSAAASLTAVPLPNPDDALATDDASSAATVDPAGPDADDPYALENTAPEVTVVEDSTPWPSPPADPTPAVTAAVAAAEASGIQQAVVIIDRSTGGVLTQIAANTAFPALSLVKLMIAADVLEGGSAEPAGDVPTAAPDATTLARLREMIVRSDDVTAANFYAEGGADELIDRVVQRYGLTGSTPTPDGEYWGNVQTTAADMASLLTQILADPATAPLIGSAMVATRAFAEDGVDQRIGMRTVPGAGSKQGWGCCLSGVVGIHSVGFTTERIVVVLSGAEPDDDSLGGQDGLALQADPGGQASIAAVNATVRAALGGPGS
jgi:hypothetical protein